MAEAYETFYVQLQYQNGSHICGGTIVSSYLILTAAHCVQDVHYRDLRVVAGHHSIRKFGQPDGESQIREIDDVIIHKEYDHLAHKNDIALLALNDSLDFRANIASILIPGYYIALTESAIVGGWINASESNLDQVETFTQTVVTIYNATVCRGMCGEDYFPVDYWRERWLCTSPERPGETQNTWQSDPGSPIICSSKENPSKRFVCGIVSFGGRATECRGKTSKTELYVNMKYYRDWIQKRSCYDRWITECPDEYSSCRNNFCVPRSSVCDRFNDCSDGSDEEYCPGSEVHTPVAPSIPELPGPRDIPFQVELQYKNTTHLCGGTILSPYLILTAAHCFDNRNCRNIQVVAGQYSLREQDANEQTMDIQKVIIHEGYDPEAYDNDIAILVLKQSITFGEDVYNALIPTPSTYLKDSAVVSGWGKVQELKEAFDFSEILLKATVTIFNATTCKETWGIDYFDPTNDTGRLCALGKADTGVKDACRGDSGGPLMCYPNDYETKKKYVCGIVSAGESSKQCGDKDSRPGLYTKVSSYYEWILNHTCSYREQQGCPTGYFRCCNHLCVKPNFPCDSENDCGDHSDERYCAHLDFYATECPLPLKCRSRDAVVCPKILESPKNIECDNIFNLPKKPTQSACMPDLREDNRKSGSIIGFSENSTLSGRTLNFTYKSADVVVSLRVS